MRRALIRSPPVSFLTGSSVRRWGEGRGQFGQDMQALDLESSLEPVALRKGLPFDRLIPNAATRRAMRELDEGRGTVCPDTATMSKDLGID